MALKSLALASLLVLASAGPAFVQPNLRPSPSASSSRTHLATSDAFEVNATPSDSESGAALGTWGSLLLGATLGLVISLGGVQRASAFQRWDEPATQGYVDPTGAGGLQISPYVLKPSKEISEECNLWTKKNKEATLKAFRDTKRPGFYPDIPKNIEQCAKQQQAKNAADIGPGWAKRFSTPTTSLGYGGDAGAVDRLSFGTPGVGKRIKPEGYGKGKIPLSMVREIGSGTIVAGANGSWAKGSGEGPKGVPYADQKAPGLGRENPALRAWAEARGIANIDKNGKPLQGNMVVDKNSGLPTNGGLSRFGNSKVLLDMPFYQKK